jgi:hypothetical protein
VDGKLSLTALREAGLYYTGKRTSKKTIYIIPFTLRRTHVKYTYNYRFWRQDCLLPLLRWVAGMVAFRRANGRT